MDRVRVKGTYGSVIWFLWTPSRLLHKPIFSRQHASITDLNRAHTIDPDRIWRACVGARESSDMIICLNTNDPLPCGRGPRKLQSRHADPLLLIKGRWQCLDTSRVTRTTSSFSPYTDRAAKNVCIQNSECCLEALNSARNG